MIVDNVADLHPIGRANLRKCQLYGTAQHSTMKPCSLNAVASPANVSSACFQATQFGLAPSALGRKCEFTIRDTRHSGWRGRSAVMLNGLKGCTGAGTVIGQSDWDRKLERLLVK